MSLCAVSIDSALFWICIIIIICWDDTMCSIPSSLDIVCSVKKEWHIDIFTLRVLTAVFFSTNRYQRGSRSLAENLSAGTTCNPAAAVNLMASSELEEEEEFGVPEETEDVIGLCLLCSFWRTQQDLSPSNHQCYAGQPAINLSVEKTSNVENFLEHYKCATEVKSFHCSERRSKHTKEPIWAQV